jgi:predicted nucleic acid-binding protein
MSFTTRRSPVVVDTGVFGARLTTQSRLLATTYSPILDQRPAIISFITVAELRFGAHHAAWGLPRRQRLETQIAQATIV